MTLSVLVNAGAVGTFASLETVAAPISHPPDAAQAIVVSDLSPPPQPKARNPDEPKPPPLEPEPEREQIKLGNPDAPESDAKAWLGVSTNPGASEAPKGSIDQAELKPGAPGEPAPAEHPSPTNSMLDSPSPEAHDPRVAAPNSPAISPAPTGSESDNETQRQIDAQDAPASPSTPMLIARDELSATIQSATEAAAEFTRRMERILDDVRRTIPRQPAPASANTGEPQRPQNAPSPAAANRDVLVGDGGTGADRESDAFSASEIFTIKPGQPLAAKGLKIKTVAPRWTISTRVLFKPRNPLVRVQFARNGKVLHAEYVPGRDAGHPDISGPLLDAIYRWTAEGKELLKIQPNSTSDGITLTFEIELR